MCVGGAKVVRSQGLSCELASQVGKCVVAQFTSRSIASQSVYINEHGAVIDSVSSDRQAMIAEAIVLTSVRG
jgi:hypothetical protein